MATSSGASTSTVCACVAGVATVVAAGLALQLRRAWQREARLLSENSLIAVPPTEEALLHQQQLEQQEREHEQEHELEVEASARQEREMRSRCENCRISRTPSKVSLEAGESRFGLDIGGSLLKLIYLELDNTSDDVVRSLQVLDNLRSPRPSVDSAAFADCAPPPRPPSSRRGFRETSLAVHVPALGGKLHFAHFATVDVEAAVEILRGHRLCEGLESIQATGGGAHKYRQLIEARLGLELHPCNELDAVVLGICLMAKTVPDECYTFERVADPAAAEGDDAQQAKPVIIPSQRLGIVDPLRKIHKPFSSAKEDFFPFLLCNVGTGVSILHVTSETEYTRVSGTALGGGTFLGLTRLLTDARHFQEALDSAANGDARRVDMLVDDIYGGDHARSLNLPGDLTASFFAKNIIAKDRDPREQAKDEDICKSLVVMIAQNLAQIAHLNARIHGAKRVFFTGNFLRANDLALRTIVYTMQRWSQLDACTTEAVFFRHEGYFGAVGAFLQTLDAEFVRDLDFEGSSRSSQREESSSEHSSGAAAAAADGQARPKPPAAQDQEPPPP